MKTIYIKLNFTLRYIISLLLIWKQQFSRWYGCVVGSDKILIGSDKTRTWKNKPPMWLAIQAWTNWLGYEHSPGSTCFTHKKNALPMLTGTLPHNEAFDKRWNNLTDVTLFMMDASSRNKAGTHISTNKGNQISPFPARNRTSFTTKILKWSSTIQS